MSQNFARVVVWQPTSSWGLPNASPFCMKLETWFRMAGIPYVAKNVTGPAKSKGGKMPYIERPDGSLMWDSSLIIETLTREHNVTLDEGLAKTDQTLGLLVQRLFEEDLYFFIIYDRWIDESGWKLTSEAYFGALPLLLRALVVPMVRRQVISAARGQGISRLPPTYRDRKGIAAISAIADVLGEKQYFLGRPSSIDAVAYGFLANLLWSPVRSAVSDSVRNHVNLVSFCNRMKETYWKDWTPPKVA